jgi:hypothetical protein
MKHKIYVGLNGAKREIFRSTMEPTREVYCEIYHAVIGPFRTTKGAIFMRDYGANNPHCRNVADAEALAKMS